MHYVTVRSHWMKKHKVGVMCLGALFVESIPFPRKRENSASTSCALDATKCTT
jgi:hypothetical protein